MTDTKEIVKAEGSWELMEKEEERLKPLVVAEMEKRGIEAIACPGVDGGYQKSSYPMTRIDDKRLKAEQPAIAAKYSKTITVTVLKSISESEE